MAEEKKHTKDEARSEGTTSTTPELETIKETLARTPAQKPEEKAPSKLTRFVRMLGIGILLLAVGAAAVFFTLYLPKTNGLNAEITAARTELTTVKAEINQLKGVETELAQTRQDLTALQGELEKANSLTSVYQIQSNVNVARIALLQGDSARASQSLEYIIQNIQNLKVPAFPNIAKDLETRLTNIRTTITTDTVKAQTDLEILFNDLILLADNLK